MLLILLSIILQFQASSGLNCNTQSIGNKPCIFPFFFNGSLENSCIRNYKNDGRLEGWCPTEVNPVNLQGSSWAECRPNCPLLYYHSHSQILQELNELEARYPKLSSVFEIGNSIQGRKIGGIRISKDGKERELLKPMVKLLGNMHGNEPVGRELLLQLARHLLGSYGLDPVLTRFIDETDLWIIPSLNPDGFSRAVEGSCEGGGYPEGRYNEGNKDLNRDFPTWKDLGKENLEKGRQLETIHLIRFILSHPFVLSANFHDGAVLVNYPWDDYHNDNISSWTGQNQAPDHEIFLHLAKTYSYNHLSMRDPNACTKWGIMEDGITNGAAWYPVIGGMQDFNYLFSNALELTMELSCCKFPPSKVLLKEWDKNRASLLSYIQQVHLGIKGLVRDSYGAPIVNADILVLNEDNKQLKEVKSSEFGEYWKLLLPGRRYKVRGSKLLQNGDILESDWMDFDSEKDVLRLDLVLR